MRLLYAIVSLIDIPLVPADFAESISLRVEDAVLQLYCTRYTVHTVRICDTIQWKVQFFNGKGDFILNAYLYLYL